MRHLLFLLALVTAAIKPAAAQKILEKSVDLAKGQRVFLELPQASNIRVRAGASGKVMLKASVNLNQNRLNDALLLEVEQAADGVKLSSNLDYDMIRAAPPGDCPESIYYGDTYISYGKNGKRDASASRLCAVIDYEITVPAGTDLRVSTLSGNIDVAGLTGPLEAKSLSGFVDVAWPATQGAELALKTITGEVYTDQEIAFTSEPKKNPIVGYQLRGTLKGSGPLVKLESISNDVYFRKRK
ncbi:hypothetical protein Q5H92_08725 [Hymenobacter sp. M29]|uniref:Adhesin domain-containing protein n=1 Tax=Hymenobacter mellowenesis TaxID=3063995 RepID=A0ABT9AA50_9BACT|nr:hypothetical protein [Hymenobacter sp. M29]MDO7846438.1 hypothetical protein [Hymenobacter sp. M29]